jgi:hypothetical protein
MDLVINHLFRSSSSSELETKPRMKREWEKYMITNLAKMELMTSLEEKLRALRAAMIVKAAANGIVTWRQAFGLEIEQKVDHNKRPVATTGTSEHGAFHLSRRSITATVSRRMMVLSVEAAKIGHSR